MNHRHFTPNTLPSILKKLRFTPPSIFVALLVLALLMLPLYLHLTAHHVRATGNIYYVDQDEGKDTCDGKWPVPNGPNDSCPWQSIAKVNGFRFQPGDTIKFEDGESWTDTGLNSWYLDPCYDTAHSLDCSGASVPTGDGQITLTNYCETDCAQPVYPVFNGNGDNATIQLHDQQWWDINNLVVSDAPSATCGYPTIEEDVLPASCQNNGVLRRGIYVYADNSNPSLVPATYQHIHVSNVTVQDVLGYSSGVDSSNIDIARFTGGIVFYASNGGGTGYPVVFDDAQVTGATLHHVYYEGIALTSDWLGAINNQPCFSSQRWGSTYYPSTNEVVENNTVWHQGGDGISVHVSSGTLIAHNIVHDGGWTGALNEGIASLDNYQAVIEQNQVYNMQFHGADIGGYADSVPFDVDDCDNGTRVEYNYSHDNQGGFVTIEPYTINAIVRYNISERDGYGDPSQIPNGVGAILKVPHPNVKPIFNAGQGWQVYNNSFYIADESQNAGPGTQLLDVPLPPGLSPAPLFENNLIDNEQNGSNDTYAASCSGANFAAQVPAGTPWGVNYNDFYSSITPGGCPDTPQQTHVINNNNNPGYATSGGGFDGGTPNGDNNIDWQQDAAVAYAPNATLDCTGIILEGSGDDHKDFYGNPLPQTPSAHNVDPGALQHLGQPSC